MTCGSPTWLVASAGLSVSRASTYVFVAGPEPPGPELAEVSRKCSSQPRSLQTVSVTDALATKTPVTLELIVNWHCPLVSVPESQVFPVMPPSGDGSTSIFG